jgi:hypothetical protein
MPGCSQGCSGSAALTPLPDGFDPTQRVENAASMRIMPSGLSFLSANFGLLAASALGNGGVIDFDVAGATGTASGVAYTICPNGSNPTSNPKVCVGEVDVGHANVTISTAAPYDVHVTGTAPFRVQDVPVTTNLCGTVTFALSGDGSCPASAFDLLPIDVDVAVHVDTNAAHVARVGLTTVVVNQVLDSTTAQANLTSSAQTCGGLTICSATIKSLLVQQIYPQLAASLTSAIDSQLCTTASAASPCPVGSTPDTTGICRWNGDPNDACVPVLLGPQGHADLTKPGPGAPFTVSRTSGLDEQLVAGGPDKNTNDPTGTLSWGDLDPVLGGGTAGLTGGAEANPLSKCVPLSSLPLPTGIPIPDELYANTIANWPSTLPGPSFAIAFSQRFWNYALNSRFNAGGFCLRISSATLPGLDSTLPGLPASAKDLGLQRGVEPIEIAMRPSTPPQIAFGNGTDPNADPSVLLTATSASFDFYQLSLGRYVRFMTATADVSAPYDLVPGGAGLVPSPGTVTVTNVTISNASLLSESPAMLATSAATALSSVLAQALVPALGGIQLPPAAPGFFLTVPPVVAGKGSPGIVKLTKGTDDFLAVFGSFALGSGPGVAPPPPPPPPPPPVQGTRARAAVGVPNATSGEALSMPTTGGAAAEAASRGAGCSAAGGRGSPGGSLLVLVVVLGASARARRRMRAVGLSAGAVLVTAAACGGGGGSSAPGADAGPGEDATSGSDAMGGPNDAGHDDGSNVKDASGSDAGAVDGATCTALQPGLIGEYTSAAASENQLWVAGYSEADWNHGLTYGDLVVGLWNGTSVTWKQVDGVPATPPPDPAHCVNGFRGGQTAPGDDVGIYTSIALDASGQPAVAYYDRTHRALKFARFDGAAWSVETVDANGTDVGAYAKLLASGSGWVLAYRAFSPPTAAGAITSAVRIATTSKGSPAASDWSIVNAVQDVATPCDPSLCASGQVCLATGTCATPAPSGSCAPACASGEACVGSGTATCQATYGPTAIEDHAGIGAYLALVAPTATSLAVAYDDRTNGNAVIASNGGGAWSTLVVDGADAMGNDTGDVGRWITMAVDGSGALNLAYAVGEGEQLRYVKVTGSSVGAYETVDDASGLGGTPFADGYHVIGADAHLAFDASGRVVVSYQDQTAGTLRYAVRDATTGWSSTALTQAGFAGAFSSITTAGTSPVVLSFWRKGGTNDVVGDVGGVMP